MDYRQVSICEFGTKRILIRQHVDLAESSSSGRIYWQRKTEQQHSSQNSFSPGLMNAVPSIAKLGLEGFIDRPDPTFHIDGTSVVIQGPLVPATPKKPIEVMCRSLQRFSFANLQMKWPNMIFSGADRIISVLHVRGLVDHKPKSFTFEDIAPKGYKNTMARASALCRHIFDYIKSIRSPDCNRMALIWVNDKQLPLDLNDGNHLVLYRRRPSGRTRDENAFLSPVLRTSILRTVQ
ncbi:unnamed protein product [Onchocerca ochengi]|nr:unnamed protein product [Onchocerca ochengi]